MAYVKTGYCSQCGDCCRSEFLPPVMSQKNNIIDDVQYCDNIRKENNLFICSMVEELLKVDSELDIGVALNPVVVTQEIMTKIDMNDEQVNWCCREMNFPDSNDEAHIPPKLENITDVHPNCTYEMVEV